MILGSSGSIGRQAIDVALSHPDDFRIIGLAAHKNVDTLLRQLEELNPIFVCLVNEEAARDLKARYSGPAKVLAGKEGLEEISALPEADLILNAIVGSSGLAATLSAINAKKQLALANKESLVAAGDLVNERLKKQNMRLIPVDSEHNALWQCMVGEDISEISKMILTASGGPFWGKPKEASEKVTPEQALDHPRWRMGRRVTIDSATLMNKGFEVIEAHHLFGIPYEKIEVLVHPQSIIHSLVEFVDGSLKAHLGPTDMRLPILYSFSWPKRLQSTLERLDLAKVQRLDFFNVRSSDSPCLALAMAAGEKGLSYPTVLNAADEVAVDAFLSEKIGFAEIGNIINTVLEKHDPITIASIGDFEVVDAWARERAESVVLRT